MGLALVLGAAFGLAHGLLITKGRIEPFIVTLGTLGVFRAYLTYFADGGAITLDNALADVYAPVYYASVLGMPVPVWIFLAVALAGGFVLNRTAFGRYVQAIGSNEQVARYAAVDVDRVRASPTCCWACAWASQRCSTFRARVGVAEHGLLWRWKRSPRHRRRHGAEGRAGNHRHGGRRRPALGHRQHTQSHQQHRVYLNAAVQGFVIMWWRSCNGAALTSFFNRSRGCIYPKHPSPPQETA